MRISLLLDCFYIDPMTMPRVLSFWAGLYVSCLFLAFFVGPRGLSCLCPIYSLFLVYILLFIDKKNNNNDTSLVASILH